MEISILIAAIIVGYSGFILWKVFRKKSSGSCCSNKIGNTNNPED